MDGVSEVRWVAADDPVLRPLISPNNTINANPGTNSLVITDYADNLRRLGRIIASLDMPAAADLDVLPIRHAVATDIATMVNRLLDGGSAGGQPGELRPAMHRLAPAGREPGLEQHALIGVAAGPQRGQHPPHLAALGCFQPRGQNGRKNAGLRLGECQRRRGERQQSRCELQFRDHTSSPHRRLLREPAHSDTFVMHKQIIAKRQKMQIIR